MHSKGSWIPRVKYHIKIVLVELHAMAQDSLTDATALSSYTHVMFQRAETLLFCADGAGENIPVRNSYRKISSKRQFLPIPMSK